MFSQDPYIYVALGVALIVALGFWSWRRERARAERLRRTGQLLGFDVRDEQQDLLEAEWAASPLFQRGRRRKARNVMHGRVGSFDGWMFDYQYTTGGGKHQRTHRLTATVVAVPGRTMPPFELRPENLLHKVAAPFGYQDIDFASHPAFSSRYLLRGQDENDVRALFDTHVLSFFEREEGWSVEGRDEWLVLYRSSRRVSPDALGQFVAGCERVARLFERQA